MFYLTGSITRLCTGLLKGELQGGGDTHSDVFGDPFGELLGFSVGSLSVDSFPLRSMYYVAFEIFYWTALNLVFLLSPEVCNPCTFFLFISIFS